VAAIYRLTMPSRDFPIIRQSGSTNCGPTSRSSRSLRSVIKHQIITPKVFAEYVILRYAFLPNIFGAEDSQSSAYCRAHLNRISQPDEGRGRCKGSGAWNPRKDFSQPKQPPITPSTPTPSDISKNAPSLNGLSHAGVVRSRRRRMISAVKPDEPASNFQQRENAMSSASHKDARGDESSCGWRDSARSSSSLPRRRGRSSSPTLVQSSYR
jgi:hypothetical protein